MRYDVPFRPDAGIETLLSKHGDQMESVHFGLRSAMVADARNALRPGDLEGMIAGLKRLGALPRYVLINARMQHPEAYFDPAHLKGVANLLERLTDAAGLTGIVFSDGYYLQALARAAPTVCSRLEAVPSVNCMIDSARRGHVWLRLVEGSGFALPSRLVLDRSLNRDLAALERTVQGLKNTWPELRLLLLANEGCLPHCPYKPAHDAHGALAGMGAAMGCGDRTFRMNREYGCLAEFMREPWRVFSSPFIRPEDAGRYEGLVDGLKLCGREREGGFLQRTISAYLAGAYQGNLLALMDALGEFEDRWRVPNQDLPQDFHDRVTGCKQDCGACSGCRELERFIRVQPESLPDFRATDGDKPEAQ